MKAILTVAMVIGSSITSVNADTSGEKPNEGLMMKQREKNIEVCTQNLVAIGKAIEAYKKEHGDFPGWLSDLHPKHLADANTLICLADEEGGKTIFSTNTDPEMPVSYGYQFHPEYREEKSEQREMYGDVMPLVRCRHHANERFSLFELKFRFKNLQVIRCLGIHPEDMYGSAEAAITAFEDFLERIRITGFL